MIEQFVNEWFTLKAYCEDQENFDQKKFKGMHDHYASRWQKLTFDMQGEICHIITERLK